MVDQDELNNISKEVKRYIINQHMKTYYYSAVALGSLIVGILLGILIS